MSKKVVSIVFSTWLLCLYGFFSFTGTTSAETASDYSLVPPFVTTGVPPLVMLVMGRDHKLYYEAYNDASDLDGDGSIDQYYKPGKIDYYGYFDSYKCYSYDTTNKLFLPAAVTTDKKCTGTNDDKWSGDFLNYLTMSRMDCLRKVLYGGYRSTDTASETILQRVYVPQDAHSWGKEYESVSRDGYDISQYTPLSVPKTDFRHLFASTTLSANGDPVLRVLPDDNEHRIWEWVSKESPVADNSPANSTYYSTGAADHAAFDNLVTTFATSDHYECEKTRTRIDGSGNPCDGGSTEYYLSIFKGTITAPSTGTYKFAVDGDDATEVIINGTVVAGRYGPNGACNCNDSNGTIYLERNKSYSIVFRHQEITGGDSYYLRWDRPGDDKGYIIVPDSAFTNLKQTFYDLEIPSPFTITDYVVRVKVGDSTMPESNCKQYPSGVYKPTGVLQKYGESNRMLFGLMTGSYTKNTSGGVLRKNVGSIADEINSSTGQISSSVNGIIKTIDKLRTYGYSYSSKSYDSNCGWIEDRAINEGECRMWGNPIAEMMYETLRYFSDAKTATSVFTYDGANTETDDYKLGLPLPSWNEPYDQTIDSVTGRIKGNSTCAKPFMLVISDINPSYDTNQLPGSASSFQETPAFSDTFGPSEDALDVEDLANTIFTKEAVTGSYYIGHSLDNTPAYDGTCLPKTVTGFGNIRGLCPEEPTKNGGFYSASVAYYGRTHDVNFATNVSGSQKVSGDQKVTTYAVALSSPLPKIEIPVGGKTITLVPFAKSVGPNNSDYQINRDKGKFQPTNTIVDFYVETLTPSYGKFRVNFEDVEQGADHDMDAIVIYEYQVNADDTAVDIKLTSEYASGTIVQHMGYIISGTTKDDTYLEVRDTDTDSGEEVDYFLDTPNDDADLPLTHTRRFYPGSTSAATLLKDPLWYAAKYGGFEEDSANSNNIPDSDSEWDKDHDGDPDNYFFVANPLELEEQLGKSFSDILRRASSGTAASVISSSRSGEGAIYQALFYPEYKDPSGNTVNWAGEVHALLVDGYGNMREDTNGNHRLDLTDDYFIEFSAESAGTIYKYKDLDADGKFDETTEQSSLIVTTTDKVKYLWSADKWLNEISSGDILTQRVYTSVGNQRHIFTFLDFNESMTPDSGEVVEFTEAQVDSIKPYIHVYPPFTPPTYIAGYRTSNSDIFADFIDVQSKRVINYIRGQDQGNYTSTTSTTYAIPAFRSRQADYDEDGTVETWRLGDIVYSTPTIVAAPAEEFDLLYNDASYADFYAKYKRRRTVVYAGGNDGMLHAFNGGFYSSTDKKFYKSYNSTTDAFSDDAGHELGSELWGYIPYNLLPHLYWLTETTYNTNIHVSYVDLKPRIFDAKIFDKNDGIHTNGWGTVLVCGMRFGGGKIPVDWDKTDGLTYIKGTDRTTTSAFIIMDITNPEAPPTVLAEISSNTLGFTTCYPTVVAMKDKVSTSTRNDWYLVLGSGPIETNGAKGNALQSATSTETGKIFLLDLKALGTDHLIKSLDSNGALAANFNTYATLDTNSFISDPISVDADLDYKTDVVYFGTVSGGYSSPNYFGGKLRRIVIDDDVDSTNWSGDSVLIDLTTLFPATDKKYGQPIIAAPTAALDTSNNLWVFFGTGRFFNRRDANTTDNPTPTHQQSYYGIKDPKDTVTSTLGWDTVERDSLLDVSNAVVYVGGKVEGISGLEEGSDLSDVKEKIAGKPEEETPIPGKSGWFLDFPLDEERNVGQATLLGDVLTFTTYVPSNDVCQYEGTSYLYAAYYGTGTAYDESIIGTETTTDNKTKVSRSASLGTGLTVTPNIHTGQEEGSEVYVQTSTGTILKIDQQNPGVVKSGKVSWKEWGE
jgi:type IV pilus assembly protein PilY1